MKLSVDHFTGESPIYDGGVDYKPNVVKYTCINGQDYQVIYIGIWSDGEIMSITLANGEERYRGRNDLELFESICRVNGLTIKRKS